MIFREIMENTLKNLILIVSFTADNTKKIPVFGMKAGKNSSRHYISTLGIRANFYPQ